MLIASVLLAVVAVGVAAAMAQTPQLTRSAREDVAIRMAMRSVVAEISAAPFSDVPAIYQGHCFDITGIECARDDEDGLPGLVRVETEGTGAGTYYVVTLSVRWRGVAGTRTISTVHYVSNVRGDTDVPDDGTGDGTGSTDPNNADDGSGENPDGTVPDGTEPPTNPDGTLTGDGTTGGTTDGGATGG